MKEEQDQLEILTDVIINVFGSFMPIVLLILGLTLEIDIINILILILVVEVMRINFNLTQMRKKR